MQLSRLPKMRFLFSSLHAGNRMHVQRVWISSWMMLRVVRCGHVSYSLPRASTTQHAATDAG